MPVSPAAAAPRGTLVVFGGGDDDLLLARLAAMLPHRHAPIEVLTTATRWQPDRTAAAYAHVWAKLGCPHVGHLEVDEDHPADDPATLERLRRAALVLLSGGDQERITDFLFDTEFLDILRARYQHDAGFIVAGTSAGAAALAGQMLVGGQGWRSLLAGRTGILPGLGLLPGVVLDQHFIERQRYPRLMHAVLVHPQLLGLGLSEETGLIVYPEGPAEVIGDEVIVVIDGAGLTHNSVPHAESGRNELVSGHGFRLHLLTAGQQLDMATREALLG